MLDRGLARRKPGYGEAARLRRRYRLIWFLSAILIPSWWILFDVFGIKNDRPFADNALLGAAMGLCYVGSLFCNWTERRFMLMHNLVIYVFTLHNFIILNVHDLSNRSLIASFIVVTATSATFVSRIEIVLYSLFVIASSLFFSPRQGPLDAHILTLGLGTTLLFAAVSIFDRIRVIESLRTSESILKAEIERKQKILTATFDGFCILDRDYRVIDANQTAATLVDLEGRNIVGENLWDLFPRARGTRFEVAYQNAMNGQQDEFQAYFEPLEKWFEVRATPSEEGIMVFFRDITARLEMEREIEEQKIKSIFAAKMSTLGEMAGGIAHEINNPLAVIQLKAEQLRLIADRGALKTEDVVKAASKIEATSMRISKIVRALRTFARDGERDPMQIASISAIVSDTFEVCTEKFKAHGVTLLGPDTTSDLKLPCRSAQISQVLLNLIANAYDSVISLQDRWVKVEVEELESSIVIRVTDSGRGIDPEIREKLFQPFFTTKEIGKGTGLGLSISQGIVASHGGHLYYDESCANTRFVMALPKDTSIPTTSAA